jgi:KaiC/GvpD/RAD55 family RecA-like ATPase
MPADNPLDLIPKDSLLVIEEETGARKEVYALGIAQERAGKGGRVRIVTSRSSQDILSLMALYNIKAGGAIDIVSTPHPTDSALFSGEWDLLIIDRFPLFVLDQSDRWLHDMLLRLAAMARTGKTIVLLMDLGVLNSGRENVIRTLADGVIQFRQAMEGDRVRWYLQIPKMRGMLPVDRLWYITITDEGIAVDTRERHG